MHPAEISHPLQLHVLKTRVVQLDSLSASFRQRLLMNPVWFGRRVQYGDDSMLLPCGDRTLLELLQVWGCGALPGVGVEPCQVWG